MDLSEKETREKIIESLINERENTNWKSMIISAVNNPQNQIANFEELRKKAVKENEGFGEKIIFENEKFKLIFKIRWNKEKLFFSYSHGLIDKMSPNKDKRFAGVDDADNHRLHRHLHSGDFVIPNPETLLEKIEHPILSLIINSETEERRSKWINKLANELRDSQINWVNYAFKK